MNDRHQISSKKFWIALTILIVLSFAITTLYYYYLPESVYPEVAIHSALQGLNFIALVGWLALFFALLAFLPTLLRIAIMVVFFIPSAFTIYLAVIFKIRLNYGCVANIAETNLIEFLSFLTPFVAILIVLYIASASFIGWSLKYLPPPPSH